MMYYALARMAKEQGYPEEVSEKFVEMANQEAVHAGFYATLNGKYNANPVLSNIMARRSIRKYLDKPVEHGKLEVIVRAGINAPSGGNRQQWVVRVVEDQKLIADVTEVYKKAHAEQVSRDKNFKNMFRNAPSLICVCTPANGGGELDAGMLGENMMLAAQAMDLGTCCLGGPVRWLNSNADARFFLDRLDIPEGYKLNYILAIGYPDEQPDAKPRDGSKVKFIK